MLNDKELENIRRKMLELDEEPPVKAWSAIQAEIKPRRRWRFFWWLSSALLVLSAISVYFLWDKLPIHTVAPSASAHVPSPIPTVTPAGQQDHSTHSTKKDQPALSISEPEHSLPSAETKPGAEVIKPDFEKAASPINRISKNNLLSQPNSKAPITKGITPKEDSIILLEPINLNKKTKPEFQPELKEKLENINPDPTKADYVVTDHLLLKAKLTVKPGVIIEFENDKGLHVFPQGTLVANGTQTERIVFTGKAKTTGFWKGILLESNNELNELDFAAVEFAGSSSFMQLQADIRANLALAGSTNSASSIKVANTLFAFSGGYGMYVQGMSELNGFSTNMFSKNTASALYVPARQVHKLDAASVFTGNNGYNGVETSGIINHFMEVTWPDLTDNGSYYVTGDISVQSGLQLAQGVSLEFMQGLVMRVENNGYLYAAGELTNKITFTARTKTANFHWGGIVFNTAHEQNKLVFAEVSYAGNKEVDTYKANVVVGAGGNVSVLQSVFTNSLGWGIVAFTHQGALLNADAGTSNTFSNMVQGNIKLTSVDVPAATLAGEWLDDWSFKRGYALDEKFYDRQANKWFRGAADPWTMNPHAGFGLKIKEDGSYIWTIAEYGPQAGCGNPYSAEYITGTVTQAANMLTFQESYWRSKFYNPCDTSQSVDLEVQPGGMTLRYEITQLYDAITGQPFWQLKIFNPDNTSFNYYRH